MQERVTILVQDEAVRLNPDRLGDLYARLGERGAEDVICRAMEELAIRLAHIEKLYRTGRRAELRKCTRSLIAISDQIGMALLARVASDVIGCVDDGDDVALGATLARLLRIADRSLTAVWDLRDLTV